MSHYLISRTAPPDYYREESCYIVHSETTVEDLLHFFHDEHEALAIAHILKDEQFAKICNIFGKETIDLDDAIAYREAENLASLYEYVLDQQYMTWAKIYTATTLYVKMEENAYANMCRALDAHTGDIYSFLLEHGYAGDKQTANENIRKAFGLLGASASYNEATVLALLEKNNTAKSLFLGHAICNMLNNFVFKFADEDLMNFYMNMLAQTVVTPNNEVVTMNTTKGKTTITRLDLSKGINRVAHFVHVE